MEKTHKSAVVCLAAVILMACFSVPSTATMQDDEKDCADQLTNLAACIPYVSGTASEPTKKCCEDTLKVKTEKPKCLCVLIKESTDPSMGLPINTTLAIKMPSVCKIDAKVSDCPSILKLEPDSPDAKLFKDASAGTTTTTPSSDAATTTTTTTPSSGSKATPTSSNGAKLKMLENWFVLVFMACCAATWMIA